MNSLAKKSERLVLHGGSRALTGHVREGRNEVRVRGGLNPKFGGLSPKQDGLSPKRSGGFFFTDGLSPKPAGLSPKLGGLYPSVTSVE